MAWNILFLVTEALGAFTVLGFFAKLWWPLDILDHFRVQYLFLLAVTGIILLLVGKSIQAMTAFLFAFINFVVIIPIYFSPEKRASSDGQIYKLLLVNVLCQNKQIAQVGELIKSVSPDIILLLEPDENWLRGLKKYLTNILIHAAGLETTIMGLHSSVVYRLKGLKYVISENYKFLRLKPILNFQIILYLSLERI